MIIGGKIWFNPGRILVLLGMCMALAACSSNSDRVEKPLAREGILDLSDWNFTEDGIFPLDGDWEIYWNSLLEPSDFRSPGIMQAKEYFRVPSFWNKQIIGGEQAGGAGYATLRLNVNLEGQEDLYRIRIIRIYTAYNAWVNGTLIASEGKVGTTRETSSPAFGLKEALITDPAGNLEIVIQISNFHHNKGGLRRKVLLGHPDQIVSHGKTTMGYDIILFTIIFVLGFGVLEIFIYNPKDRSPLYFGLACLFTASNALVVNEMPRLYYFPGIRWETVFKIDYLSLYLETAFFVAFFRNIFPRELSRIFSKGVLLWAGVSSLIILVTKARFYTGLLFLFEILVGVIFLYLVSGLVMALIRRRKGAVLSVAGIFALMAAAGNDILHNELIIHSRFLFPVGLLICIATHTVILTIRFTELYNSVGRLMRRLLSLDKIKNAFIKNASRDNLESPFKAILQNANAEKGFLYIWEESKWVLKVFMSLVNTESVIPPSGIKNFSTPVKDQADFPYHMVRMAIEEKRNMAFPNAEGEDKIQNDPYISQFLVKSAFCMRIESEGTLIGLLYLENQYIEGAFSDEILEMLGLLSPQLTTMLDNIEIFRQLKMLNRSLEQKVRKRSAELVSQKQILEETNLKINDSIQYAKHIQDSILVPEEEIGQYIPELFIYNKPRETVSGDFYWFSRVKNILVIAAIDCTGHGIPGAFMSMIGHTLLNNIVNEMNILMPSQIMKYLNRGVKELLHQSSSETHAQDGMDLALCTINPDTRILQYCGAKNSLYLVRGNKLETLRADPWSVGGLKKRSGTDGEVQYTNHTINLDGSVSVYMLTDGYLDQFGGKQEEKFNIDRFLKLLGDISDIPLNDQKQILTRTMEEWKGNQRQIDDMLVIGMRI